MSSLGSTMIALADDGRLFGLDYQLLFDASITAINVFILFILLSFILFNPVRNMLKKRQDKITSDRENAEADKKEALAMKQEYEAKLKAANKEAEGILSDARKVAKHNEEKIVADAKQEAARIIARANTEAELEKQKAADEVKQQIIAVARLMASKVVVHNLGRKHIFLHMSCKNKQKRQQDYKYKRKSFIFKPYYNKNTYNFACIGKHAYNSRRKQIFNHVNIAYKT